MTTIAWDGTTLAADSCSWTGGVRRKTRKVFKVNRDGRTVLVAFCGSQPLAVATLAWMRGEAKEPDYRHYGADANEMICVMIDEKKRVWELSTTLIWQEFRERIFARGAGCEFAWGALEAGATAKRAIEITAKRSDYAALGVDCVRFA